mmetsp:Transcript_64364/g.167174  ORF Transcript_64364/g.167174 Transcript_64364/m.167174 type:complete len:264 (-) Transcript_64364:533-1324(-)
MDSKGLSSQDVRSLLCRIQAPGPVTNWPWDRGSCAVTHSPRSQNQMKVPKKNKAIIMSKTVIKIAGDAFTSTLRNKSWTSLSCPRSAFRARPNLKIRVTRAKYSTLSASISATLPVVIHISTQYGTTERMSKRAEGESRKLQRRTQCDRDLFRRSPSSTSPEITEINSLWFKSSRRACPTDSRRPKISAVKIQTQTVSMTCIQGGSSGTQASMEVLVQFGGGTRTPSTVPAIQHVSDNTTATKIVMETILEVMELFSAMSSVK